VCCGLKFLFYFLIIYANKMARMGGGERKETERKSFSIKYFINETKRNKETPATRKPTRKRKKRPPHTLNLN